MPGEMATLVSLVPPLRTTVLTGAPGVKVSVSVGVCGLGFWEAPEVQWVGLTELESADLGQDFAPEAAGEPAGFAWPEEGLV